MKTEGDIAGLRVMHRKTDNGEMYFLYREIMGTGEYRICLPADGGYRLTPEDGSVRRLTAPDGVVSICLSFGETVVLLLNEELAEAEDEKTFTVSMDVQNTFAFRREKELVCDDNGFAFTVHTEEPVLLELGDWEAFVGSAYSGSGVYTTTFQLSEEQIGKEVWMDLGEVHHTAYVKLNGREIGTLLMPPYRLSVPKGALKSENQLEITVVNTAGNWYVHTDYFEKWDIRELSPYFKAEREIAKDFMSGGLYGPIKLWFTEK